MAVADPGKGGPPSVVDQPTIDRLYESLFEHSADGIMLTRPDGAILRANPAACRLLGWTEEQICRLGRERLVVDDPSLRTLLVERHEKGVSSGDLQYRRADGTLLLAHVVSAIIPGPGGTLYAYNLFRDVGQIRRAEEGARAAQQLSQATLDSIPEQVCVVDERGTILAVNAAWRAFARANGAHEGATLEGANYLAVCEQADGPCREEAVSFAGGLRGVLAGAVPSFALEYPCHSPTEQRWFVGRASRIVSGASVRAVVSHQDVTEIKRFQIALRLASERLEAALATSQVAVASQDRDLRYTWIQDRTLGSRAALAIGKRERDFLRAEDAAVIEAIKQEVLATGVRQRREVSILDEGRERTLDLSVEPQRDAGGAVVGVTSVAVDLTERKRGEQRLAAALEFNQRLLSASPVGISAYEVATGRCVLVNQAMEEITGATHAQLLAQDFRRIASWRESGLLEAAEAAIRTGAEQRRTVSARTSFGRELWCTCVFATFPTERGQHLLNLVSDVTERMQGEEALRVSETRYRTLADSITDAVFAYDAQLRYTFWNRECERRTGIAARDAIGKAAVELYPEFAGSKAEQVYREVLRTGVPRSFETPFALGGRVRHYDVDCYPSAGGLTVLSRDVTERRDLQERARRAERLSALTTLVAGMAHEINNPLVAVLGNLEFARELLGRQQAPGGGEGAAGEELAEAVSGLRDAAEGARRIQEIVAALRAIAPRNGAEGGEASADLKAAVQLALVVARHAVERCAAVTVQVPALPRVALAEGDLVQVLVNLLVNAGQATGDRPNRVLVSAAQGEAGAVVLAVRDTGAGMSPEVLARVFDPFYSTKGVGAGRGLGLPVCRGILLAAGGDIRLESTPGAGTAVTVVLPAAVPARS